MSDSWDDADTSDFFTIKDNVGALVIIAVNKFTPNFETTNGPRDTIHAELVVVDNEKEGVRYAEALLFGSKLVPQLKGKMGATVLGRIELGQKSPGKNAPYILAKATDEDKKVATAWTKNNGDVVAQKHVSGNTLTSVAAGDDEDFPY